MKLKGDREFLLENFKSGKRVKKTSSDVNLLSGDVEKTESDNQEVVSDSKNNEMEEELSKP